MSSGPVLHFCQVPLKHSKGYLTYRADMKSFLNKTKSDNFKSKKARVVNLVCYMSSRPDLQFNQVSSKYSKGYSSYRADKKFYTDANANRICPKNNMSPPPPQPFVGGGHNYSLSANQITLSRLLMLYILNDKQCRSR